MDKENSMLNLAICLRALQLYSQHAHNLCARMPFHQDHAFFADVYNFADDSYDSVIERIIGTKGEEGLQLKSILKGVYTKLDNMPDVGVKENKAFYTAILSQQKYINDEINMLVKSEGMSEGTKQLIGGIADALEVLIYKTQRRLL